MPTPTARSIRLESHPNGYSWIPGTFESEAFEPLHQDTGYLDTEPANLGGAYRPGEGVDIEATSDLGGGYDVTQAKAGEWIEYAWARVLGSGNYVLRIRVASSGPGGRFHVEVGGVNVTGTLTIPDTGGWQQWQTLSQPVWLGNIGTFRVKFVMEANGPSGVVGNFNSFTFDPGPPVVATPTPTPTPTPTVTPTATPTPTPTVTATVRVQPSPCAAWQAWTWYGAGTVVCYEGAHYLCIQAHTSQPNWMPPAVAALWQRQP
jgi:hypothetical protein